MRKWISIILVFTMVVMLSGAVTAIEMQQDISPVMFTTSGEQKIYSNATTEDDFADNRVMVVMSHEASMRFCDCGHTIYEAHAWNVARTKCLVCGYNANGPGILDALRPGME